MNDPRDPNDTDYDPYFDETFDDYGSPDDPDFSHEYDDVFDEDEDDS